MRDSPSYGCRFARSCDGMSLMRNDASLRGMVFRALVMFRLIMVLRPDVVLRAGMVL